MKIDRLLDKLYQREEEQIYEEDLHSDPHGYHWSTSFHASDPRDCPRKSIYTLLNVPSPGPINRPLRAMGEAGKAIEDSIVWRFHRAGILLSAPPNADYQTQLINEECWLSAAPDCIIRLPTRPHPIEIKSKSQHIIDGMREGTRTFEEKHLIQLLTQIGLASDQSHELWPNLEKCRDGTILYVSRNDPSQTVEYTFQHEEKVWLEEKQKLIEWKEAFLEGKLPERPSHFKWSEEPCKYCPFKKEVCKPDFQENIVDLDQSHAISWAKKIRKEYDYELQRNDVIARWMPIYM